jgi:hypothetical protein
MEGQMNFWSNKIFEEKINDEINGWLAMPPSTSGVGIRQHVPGEYDFAYAARWSGTEYHWNFTITHHELFAKTFAELVAGRISVWLERRILAGVGI